MVQLSTPTPTLRATMHSVIDGRTDRQHYDMPTADHTVRPAKIGEPTSKARDKKPLSS